jgi:single-strand DNA-binding protein
MNSCFFIGNLVRDPEVSYAQSGTAIARFSLAINDGYGDKKKTYFPSFTAFGKTAETIGNTLNKGRKIVVDARYTQDNYEDKDGNKKQSSKFIVNTFEYADSKKTSEQTDMSELGKDVPESEVPFF